MSTLCIVGITRFSVLNKQSLSSFHQTRSVSLEAAKAIVFSPKRLSNRFRLFRTFALPSIAAIAASHRQFQHIILTSAELPQEWKTKLYAIASRAPWLKIVELAPADSHIVAARDAVQEFSSSSRTFTFRLDDDDALSSAYVDAIVSATTLVPDNTVLSFDTGFKFQQGRFGGLILSQRVRALGSAGLGYVRSGSDTKTIFDLGSHTEIGGTNAVHHIADKPYWIRTFHDTNDTERNRRIIRRYTSFRHLRSVLAKDFPYVNPTRAVAVLARL